MSSVVDVLVVGAGPAGLLCAYNLSQAGFLVRIVDKLSEPSQEGKADMTHIRGMEVLDSMGLSQEILAQSERCVQLVTYSSTPESQGKITLESRRNMIPTIESPFSFATACTQSTIETVIRNAMASGEQRIKTASYVYNPKLFGLPRKVQVERELFPVALDLSDNTNVEYPVAVRLSNSTSGYSETVSAKYVLGCDGAHSWVRQELGIQMVGETSDQVWGLIDGFIDTDFPDIRNITAVNNNDREKDMVRVSVQIPESYVRFHPSTGRIDRSSITEELIKKVAQDILDPYTIRFKGHTHSPHAAQGMNTAFYDAHNISWKLAHVLKGWSGPALLCTYESERRGFAERLIELHERIGEVMLGRAAGNLVELAFNSLRMISGTGTCYPASQVIHTAGQSHAHGITIGERMPHQVILRAADYRPFSTLDLLRFDNMYKLIVLAGDVKDPEQYKRLEKLESDIEDLGDEFLNRVQLYVIMQAKKETCSYLDVPRSLRSHWDTVFIDDVAYLERDGGGNAYRSFGVSSTGCLVLVRPDGHVSGLAPLDGVRDLNKLVMSTLGETRD
ncbi:Phenol 2-monooxygenase [Rhizoctonia solani AG-1 IB]|uniref:Phenol 2-monooxygenase n=1 Tax=Thanatephorus cucumeris (strain AG1-IB / isolate 7/3/14) TaxID=1108050 RepID=M5CFZ9_THACB|nr:Phenol 2-monooxygenase [Rhizoctonia solani AG-1 IB]